VFGSGFKVETKSKDVERETGYTKQVSFSTDAIFETLSNRRRRYVLHYLKRVGEPVSVRELSERLAAWENQIPRSAVRPQQRKRLYTAMHQTHLPKMAELGVVDYDPNRSVVSLAESVEQFDIYFEMVGKDQIPWGYFYLALGSVLTSLVVVAMLKIPPFTAVSGFTYALAITLLLTAVGVYHAFRDRSRVIGSVDVPPETVQRDTLTAPDEDAPRPR